VVTIGTAALFGIAPALHASRQEPQAALKEGGPATAGRRGRRVAGGLVMAQLALALLLLAGAGLLIKTVARSMSFDPGFDASRVLQGDVSLPALRYATPGSIATFASAVMEGLGRIPGTRAGIQGFVFFRGFGARGRTLTVEGMAAVPEGASPGFYFVVTPGYFRVLGAPIRQGREFAPADGSDVVVVNETMAERLWGNATPLGKRVKFGDKPWRTVVGVVGNINGGSIAARPNPLAYVPLSSEPVHDLTVTIAADRDVAGLAREVRAAVHAVDRDQPVEDLMTMAAMYREQAAPARFVALLMSGLAFVALALASVGLYGVTAHGVRRRLREIGIRIALGGTASDVMRLVLGSAWKVIAPGLLLGTAAAYAGTRTLQGILFGTSPTDPIVFAATVATLALVATLASYLPARQAARVDPIVVLRAQ
jgi:putative ABC transport system permease protein